MEKFLIGNMKGGVGKSTTAINLAAFLAERGKTLLVDMDPQGHASLGIGFNSKDKKTIAEMLKNDNVSYKEVIYPTHIRNLDIMPSDLRLSIAELEISSKPNREYQLRNKLEGLEQEGYEYVIIDTPPTFGSYTINSFAYADKIILPVELSYFSTEGILVFVKGIEMLNNSINKTIKHRCSIFGALLTFFDTRTKHSQKIYAALHEIFGNHIFNTKIPINVTLKEAQLEGKSIFEYAPTSAGALAYKNLGEEILERMEK